MPEAQAWHNLARGLRGEREALPKRQKQQQTTKSREFEIGLEERDHSYCEYGGRHQRRVNHLRPRRV